MQDLLFYGQGELRDYLEAVKREAIREIEGIDTNSLLNSSEEDFVRYLVGKFSPDPPILDLDNKSVSGPADVEIDVSQDRLRAVFDRNRPFYVKGVRVIVTIPFVGDATYFRFTPSSFTFNPPRAAIVGQEVRLIYQRIDPSPEDLRKEIDQGINSIQQYLGWVKRDIDAFNQEFELFILEQIKQRKQKKLKDLNLVEKLGIPVRKLETMPRTYSIPEIRRKPKIARPKSGKAAFAPEPALEIGEYENILCIVRNMALVLERSPSAFEKMKEEDLRQHFLVQLNGQYEGTATGETFNYQGKTDILIRHEGKNAFIAECKFWKGEKGFTDTIDQILNYISWRDTKTAIILFNRGKNFSSVLEQISSIVEAHPNFKRAGERRGETEFRFILHQPDDENRELILTIMAFNVPVL